MKQVYEDRGLNSLTFWAHSLSILSIYSRATINQIPGTISFFNLAFNIVNGITVCVCDIVFQETDWEFNQPLKEIVKRNPMWKSLLYKQTQYISIIHMTWHNDHMTRTSRLILVVSSTPVYLSWTMTLSAWNWPGLFISFGRMHLNMRISNIKTTILLSRTTVTQLPWLLLASTNIHFSKHAK